MLTPSEFHCFATNLEEMGINETTKAIACLWYADCANPDAEMTAKELAERLGHVGLARNVNVSRLARSLRGDRGVVKGSSSGAFRVSPTRRASLSERFGACLKIQKPRVSDAVIPDEVVNGTRKYLEQLAHQINGCYDYGFYDGCAVLCRRMVESLLVEAFDRKGQLSAIQKPDKTVMMLDGIIGHAKSGKYIRLPRGTSEIIEKIKQVGDTAAHDRYHIAGKRDIDDFAVEFRKVISQLVGLAGITTASPAV